jgi:hypothetical protein
MVPEVTSRLAAAPSLCVSADALGLSAQRIRIDYHTGSSDSASERRTPPLPVIFALPPQGMPLTL